MNNTPLVSIIVPSFNHEKYIGQCIESIISQTYKNIELIVIDDGSKDNSRKILEELQSKYKFRLIFQENCGIAITLNRGIIEFSKGDFITFCASDDYWTYDKLEKQVSFMERNRFYPMCYGRTHYVNENSNIIKKFDQHNKFLKGGWLFEDIIAFNLHPPVTYLFRAEIFKEVGYYDQELMAEDFDMNIRIASKYAIGYLDEYLGYYRITDVLFKTNRFDRVSDSHLKSIEKFRNHKIHKKARTYVFLRKFDAFSSYKSLKIKAIQNLFKSSSLFYKTTFWKSIIKLLIYWRS